MKNRRPPLPRAAVERHSLVPASALRLYTILLWGSGSWEPGNSWNTPGALLSFAQSIMSEAGVKEQSHFQSKVWVTGAGAVSPL